MEKQPVKIKPYSNYEMARLYGICSRTFSKWIRPVRKKIGERPGRYYTATQVQIIVDHIGLPYKMQKED